MLTPYRTRPSYGIDMDSEWKTRRQLLAQRGLNAWGIADGRPYAHLLEGCQSVVVLGSGAKLMDAFVANLQENPPHLYDEDHPVDAYVHRILDEVDPLRALIESGSSASLMRPARSIFGHWPYKPAWDGAVYSAC